MYHNTTYLGSVPADTPRVLRLIQGGKQVPKHMATQTGGLPTGGSFLEKSRWALIAQINALFETSFLDPADDPELVATGVIDDGPTLRDLQKALSRNIAAPDINWQLGNYWSSQGDTEGDNKAFRFYTVALKNGFEAVPMLCWLARYSQEAGDVRQAQQYARRAYRLQVDDVEDLYHLGVLLLDLGLQVMSRGCFAKILQVGSSQELAREIITKIRELLSTWTNSQ